MSVHAAARRVACWLALAAAGLWMGGCQPGGYSGPTGTVSGKVTLAGKAVPQGCLVTFVPNSGPVASAAVGADGTYKLAVAGKPQVPALKYKVSVTPPAPQGMSQQDYDKMMSVAGAPPKPAEPPVAIPVAYQSVGTTKLSFEVKQGPNTIDIALE